MPNVGVGASSTFYFTSAGNGLCASTIFSHVPATGYVHELNGSIDPRARSFVQKLPSACHKQKRQQDLRLSIDKSMLNRLLRALEVTEPGKHHRALYRAMFNLAFHAFLRIRERTVLSTNTANKNLLRIEQLEVKDTSMSITCVHFKHSAGQPLTLTVTSTLPPPTPDCRLQLMKTYPMVPGRATSPLFLYSTNMPSQGPSLTST